MGACHSLPPATGSIGKSDITVALVGNSNVGKSALFNEMTGADQVTGNWPGKTVERAEGLLRYKGLKIKVIDLPGIYSLSTFSMEEMVSRDFIANERPDIVVNVVDATALERNLFFTMQIMEMGCPMVVVLNQTDMLEKKGISVDYVMLEKMLGVPVVPTVATEGKGIARLVARMVDAALKKKSYQSLKYGREVEHRISKLVHVLRGLDVEYPARWLAIKLLEKDTAMTKLVEKHDKRITRVAKRLAGELEKMHGEPSSVVISAERYGIADSIGEKVQTIGVKKRTLSETIDKIALHPILGYFMVVGVIGGLLVWTFLIGAGISSFITDLSRQVEQFEPVVSGGLLSILWNGAFTGFIAGVTLVIPYVLPFYIMLSVIDDSGYLTRISVMLDRGMHRLGLHGKAIIPLILGYGCNVPACFSCRIMETPKQKFLSAFLVTLVPCTARTVVILGLVAAFVNIWWAIALYVFDIILIIILGRLAFKLVPGESLGLIMEMPDYHVPSLKVALRQTWIRMKSLLWVVFPAYIVGSAALQAFYAAGLLAPVNDMLNTVTVWWLGLPVVSGILLIFGIVRKELTILMLAVIFQTTNFAFVMTPVQLIVLALVSMIYVPCLATIFAISKEFGWKKSMVVTLVEIGLAVLIGGIAFRLLSLIM